MRTAASVDSQPRPITSNSNIKVEYEIYKNPD